MSINNLFFFFWFIVCCWTLADWYAVISLFRTAYDGLRNNSILPRLNRAFCLSQYTITIGAERVCMLNKSKSEVLKEDHSVDTRTRTEDHKMLNHPIYSRTHLIKQKDFKCPTFYCQLQNTEAFYCKQLQ